MTNDAAVDGVASPGAGGPPHLTSGVVAREQTDVFGIVGTVQAGSFHVERVVAEGGFGVVYRAQHAAFRAPVALKCLKIPGQLDAAQRASFLEKFRGEAELLFHLSASIPEVVRPLHVDELSLPEGRFAPFLALEWLEGRPLSDVIEARHLKGKAPIELTPLIKLLTPVAQALAKAHRFQRPEGVVSIIHRDLKPENIFLMEHGGQRTVRILDYGIAKARAAASTEAGRATNDNVLMFTPAYAAPEQWNPQQYGQTGSWTDVWGLAITMVEALIGRPPIEGELHNMLFAATNEAQRPTPGQFGIRLPVAAENAFTAALTVDPRARTQTIEQLWTALETAVGLPASFARVQGKTKQQVNAGAPTLAPSFAAQGRTAEQRSIDPLEATHLNEEDVVTSDPGSMLNETAAVPLVRHAGPAKAATLAPASLATASAGELELDLPPRSGAAGATAPVGDPRPKQRPSPRPSPASRPSKPPSRPAHAQRAKGAAAQRAPSNRGAQAGRARPQRSPQPMIPQGPGRELDDDFDDAPAGIGVITVDKDKVSETERARDRAAQRARTSLPDAGIAPRERPSSETKSPTSKWHLPIGLAALAIAIVLVGTIGEQAGVIADGSVGGVRLTWIAAVALASSMLASVWRFFSE